MAVVGSIWSFALVTLLLPIVTFGSDNSSGLPEISSNLRLDVHRKQILRPLQACVGSETVTMAEKNVLLLAIILAALAAVVRVAAEV